MKKWISILLMALFCQNLLAGQSSQKLAVSAILTASEVAANPHSAVEMISVDDGKKVFVSKKPILTFEDFKSAKISEYDDLNLQLNLRPEAIVRLNEFTAKNTGRHVGFLMEGQLLKVPLIREPIKGPGFQVNPIKKELAQRIIELIENGSAQKIR